ncbi:MAG: putative 4-hydroxybenzoate polyprenyltransferase [Leptospiraceae bacterium]|jgi:4-hydroxybenzoate polyprenyltransferase|nr:putative 4-hydroxybenzoate polyprenyltransferase [Leptospiraceae bacterium]MCZ8346393.1 putative 4-hydroxybenzoate polyprenyltransferase [Leptospiraceae bacterium]PJE01785.1 MAG: 4-hydroxybenzoate octaprenyltransferase [Leptospira sp.]
MKFIQKFFDYGRMIKFSHSLFALPFAGIALILAFLESDFMLQDIVRLSGLIIICLISARSAAMGFNRYIDAEIDKKNPRTNKREIPAGVLSPVSVLVFIGVSCFVFLFASYLINFLCFVLAFPALAILFFYSLAKRFTLLCHFILGFSLSMAPLGAWIAIAEDISLVPILFSLGLLFHITGFDILYAIQDADFDSKEALHSIPAKLGIQNSFHVSRILHILAIFSFLIAGKVADLGLIYYISIFIIGLLLIWEHRIAKDMAREILPPSFYTINSFISVVIFFGILFDRWGEFIGKLQILVKI